MRIIDRNRFLLLGGVTDWRRLARLHGPRSPARVKEQAARRGLESLEIVQLRWLTAKALGYPTEPFTVWRRPAGDQELHEPRFRQLRILGLQLVIFDTPQLLVRARVDGAQGGVITAWAGAPWTSTLVGQVVPGSSTQFVSFSATALQSLVLPASATLSEVTALDDSLAEDPRWEPIETVALPVTPEWAGVGGFGGDQGLLQAPVPPPEAAIDRFRRGAPLLGWHEELRTGIPAPPWELADPKAMVQVLHDAMLPDLLMAVTTLPQERQHEFEIDHVLDSHGGNVPALLRHRPLETLLYGASTDGLSSLVSGFGSAYEETLVIDERHPAHAAHDYMVTARYENGVGAEPGPAEFAAVLHHPPLLAPPPAPANLRTEVLGLNAPAQRDGRWAPVLRLAWDALAAELGLRVGAYAFAREDLTPAGGVVPLMRPRLLDTALQPLGMGPTGPAAAERAATDDTVQIDPALDPNTMHHAVAHHDLFGLFSTWSLSPAAVREPPVGRATITAARFDVLAAAPGTTTPADLVLDLTWDWSVRAPDLIQVAGRLYPQARLGEPPADRSVPAGLAASLIAPGAPLQIAFEDTGAAAVSVAPGLTAAVRYLSADGKQAGDIPVADAGPRRYRVTVSGYQLDFDAAARQGMALWASGREKLPPQRHGPWSAEPVIASTADPRPPVLVNTREFVQLAGLADPDGRHHAVLEWDPAPGASSYFAYTCAEAKFLADRSLPPPDRAQTLEQRLVRLRDAFAAAPNRRSFDRVNALPVPGTRMPLVLPRGTKELHLYLVLGLSAGQVESTWPAPGSPSLRNRFVAFAAPQVVAPAAPQLEVARMFDPVGGTFGAAVRIRSAPGALVSRLDLHRVRVPEAAVDVDSMGPPIAAITGTAAPFTVSPAESGERGAAQVIGTVRGTDPVPGSWRAVHYRAVAWSADDPARGLVGGRSPASAVRTVVVPPAAPPGVEALSWRSAGADVVVDTAVLAPVAQTPLGPHRVTVAVHAHHPDGSVHLVLRHPAPATPPDVDADRLDRVPETPGALWRDPSAAPAEAGGPGRTPLHLAVPRSTVDDALTVRLRVTDPLGRFTEQLLEVPPGPPTPPPDILDPRVVAVVPRGRFLDFETTVPDTDGLGRPYQLSIAIRPPLVGLRPRPLRVRFDLADIPVLRPGDDLAADLAADRSPIPVRRSARGAGTGISALLRINGAVSVVLTAPDGTRATWSGPRREF